MRLSRFIFWAGILLWEDLELSAHIVTECYDSNFCKRLAAQCTYWIRIELFNRAPLIFLTVLRLLLTPPSIPPPQWMHFAHCFFLLSSREAVLCWSSPFQSVLVSVADDAGNCKFNQCLRFSFIITGRGSCYGGAWWYATSWPSPFSWWTLRTEIVLVRLDVEIGAEIYFRIHIIFGDLFGGDRNSAQEAGQI